MITPATFCVPFDDKSCEHGYQNDVLAFVCVCKEWGIPCYIERSRSGNGAHVWIFFEAPIAVTKAKNQVRILYSNSRTRTTYVWQITISIRISTRFLVENSLLQKKKDWYRYLSFQQIYNRCLSLWSVLISCENIGLV